MCEYLATWVGRDVGPRKIGTHSVVRLLMFLNVLSLKNVYTYSHPTLTK